MRKLIVPLLSLLPLLSAPVREPALHETQCRVFFPRIATDVAPAQSSSLAWYPVVMTAVATRLAGAAPLDAPVAIAVVDIPGMWGYSYYNEMQQQYEIVLSPYAQDPDFLMDIMIHEWAHCLIWGSGMDEGSDHGSEWGIAYAMCYRAVVEGPPIVWSAPPQVYTEEPSAPEEAPPAEEPPAEKCGD